MVAEKPVDLKQYGLDAPEARWKLFAGDKDLLHLLVGKADKSGRHFAKRETGEGVFAIDKELSGTLGGTGGK